MTKIRLFFLFFLLLLCTICFWVGNRSVFFFFKPPSDPTTGVLQAIARRGFLFEHDMEAGNLSQATFKACTQHIFSNLRACLAYHKVDRQAFHVSLQRHIFIEGGTHEQVAAYHELMTESMKATSEEQKYAIEEKKKQLLSGAFVKTTVQTFSFPVPYER